MWERIKTVGEYGLYRGKDAEGRRCYAVSRDVNGCSVTPSGFHIFYSQKAAIEEVLVYRAERVTDAT